MYPVEYIQYLVHFHGDRDYFECHEILEDYWKEGDTPSKDSIWVGFILLAVSTYHHRRRNLKGAKRTLEKALKIFSLQEDQIPKLGLDSLSFFSLIKNRLAAIEKGEIYKSFQLPLSDPSLLGACMNACEQIGIRWGEPSHLDDIHLVNRHKLRDRTLVIQERTKALKQKKGNES